MDSAVPNRGPTALKVIWALTPLALVTAILRIIARLRNRKFGWDDIFMVLAMTRYTCQPFGIIGIAAGKVSVAALLLGIIRLSELRWHRLFLRTVPITLAVLIAIACSTLTFAQCSPAEALWDKRVTGKCIDPKVMSGFGTFTGSFNTFADATLAIIPATIFWQLQSSTTEKVQLTIDQTWATYDIFVWVTGELFLMIVCGSIPTLHVVLTWFRSAVDSVRSRVSPYPSRKSPGSSRAKSSKDGGGSGNGAIAVARHGTELSDFAHMRVKTKTTIERTSHVSASESVDHLVEEKSIPDNSVRVVRMYDIRRDSGGTGTLAALLALLKDEAEDVRSRVARTLSGQSNLFDRVLKAIGLLLESEKQGDVPTWQSDDQLLQSSMTGLTVNSNTGVEDNYINPPLMDGQHRVEALKLYVSESGADKKELWWPCDFYDRDTLPPELNHKLRMNRRDTMMADSHGDIWVQLVAAASKEPGMFHGNDDEMKAQMRRALRLSGEPGFPLRRLATIWRYERWRQMATRWCQTTVGRATFEISTWDWMIRLRIDDFWFMAFRQVLGTLAQLPCDAARLVSSEDWKR
ncbi:integral membrane protein [Purpureocillium lavendulum]|uniref:Integral membrane protein n=1 Tax=Purpureocillium lavendulum TaxID=1247861 RepID=A0AB34FIE8_9HYPO|nr:integral membrane protein [Purpureocillium lavendulum]